jgi:DNA polymerase-3 subunit delta
MNALAWLRDPSRQTVRPVFAIHGDDSYLVRESIRSVMRIAVPGDDGESGITRFTGGQATLAAVLDELWTLPFFSKQRLVIVDEADGFISKHRRELEDYVKSPSKSAVFLLQPKLFPANTNLAKLVEEFGQVINCSSPREAEVAGWLVQLALARDGVTLEPEAASLLVELVGGEAGVLASEVAKLAVYAGDSRTIERADVARMVGGGRVETVWAAIEAATLGQGRHALELLDNLIAAGEHPVGLLAAMSYSLLKVHQCGYLRAGRMGLDEACRMAGIKAIDLTRRQHAHLGPSRVDALPESLARADFDLKGASSLEPRVVLEQLFVRLARPRRD